MSEDAVSEPWANLPKTLTRANFPWLAGLAAGTRLWQASSDQYEGNPLLVHWQSQLARMSERSGRQQSTSRAFLFSLLSGNFRNAQRLLEEMLEDEQGVRDVAFRGRSDWIMLYFTAGIYPLAFSSMWGDVALP